MATYSQDLVVIDPVTMGDQRTVGNRIFSEDERWLYRIEPGSDYRAAGTDSFLSARRG